MVSRIIHRTGKVATDRSERDPVDCGGANTGCTTGHTPVTTDYVVDEGRVQLPSAHSVVQPPFVIPYDAMLPQRAQLTNVLGSVALSATHVRFNALRMEPTWMVIGQAAGVAAAMAAGAVAGMAPSDVQMVNVTYLREALTAQGQIIGV